MAFSIPPAVMQMLVQTLAKSSPQLLEAAKAVAEFDAKIDRVLAQQALIMETLNVRPIPIVGVYTPGHGGRGGNEAGAGDGVSSAGTAGAGADAAGGPAYVANGVAKSIAGPAG